MGKTINKKIELKPILRVRVRCKEPHKDPWIRRLYALWATAPPPDASPSAHPTFFLAQTDDKGYLSPPKNNLDPSPHGTLPMFKDHEYLFYFIRWPDAGVAKKILEQLTNDYNAATQEWGKAAKIAPVFKSAGKAKSGQQIMEAIIELEEKPDVFVKGGSSFYGGWTLFRDMPGSGSNQKDTDIQCPPLKRQIRRLQYHLGRLRYPIGNQWHPYSPEPWTDDATRKSAGKGQSPLLYPNEGVFDIVTWNAVLAFQRDARQGLANEHNPDIPLTDTLDSSFDPLPAAQDWHLEMRESSVFLADKAADRSAGFADIPDDCDTVVEETTAAAIKNWLERKLRKPGKILVSYAEQYDSWMQQDVRSTIESLDKELQRLRGLNATINFNNAFRDTRMSVLQAGKGQKINSIHKSGFAFDMAMDHFVGPLKNYPLYFVRDEADQGAVRWIVYTTAAKNTLPEGTQIGSTPQDTYLDTIFPWQYEPDNPQGGRKGPALQIDARIFLNFTKVCQQFGLKRISARSDWVPLGQTQQFSLDTPQDFKTFVAQLSDDVSYAKNTEHPSRQTKLPDAIIDGSTYNLVALEPLSSYLRLWYKIAGRLDATPDVEVAPGSKEGEALLRNLRGWQKLKGKKVQIAVDGWWTGGTGSSNVKSGVTSTADLELGPKTEFPTDTDFVLRPLTEPVVLKEGSRIELPVFGTPNSMEWWHFQYASGFANKDWKTILGLIGWTEEGLLGKAGGMPIKGHYGLGYLRRKHLDQAAS